MKNSLLLLFSFLICSGTQADATNVDCSYLTYENSLLFGKVDGIMPNDVLRQCRSFSDASKVFYSKVNISVKESVSIVELTPLQVDDGAAHYLSDKTKFLFYKGDINYALASNKVFETQEGLSKNKAYSLYIKSINLIDNMKQSKSRFYKIFDDMSLYKKIYFDYFTFKKIFFSSVNKSKEDVFALSIVEDYVENKKDCYLLSVSMAGEKWKLGVKDGGGILTPYSLANYVN